MNCCQVFPIRNGKAHVHHPVSIPVLEEYQRLAEENKRLHQLIVIQNQAIIDAAHNLRNPLTSILLSIPVIEKYFSENPLTHASQQSVVKNLAKITRITNHINDILSHLIEVQEIVNESAEPKNSPSKKSNTNDEHINDIISHMLEVRKLVNQNEATTLPYSRVVQSRGAQNNGRNQTNTELLKPEALVPLKRQAIKYAPLVRLLVEEYRSRASLKNITIKYEERLTREIWVIANQRAVTEIIENLLSNAIKYSYPNSAILVKLAEYHDNIHETVVRVVVEDTGKGMSVEEVQRVFQPKANISTRPTAGEESHGIGLSIAKRYADAMSFRLTCRSHPGAGTQFILEKWEILGKGDQ